MKNILESVGNRLNTMSVNSISKKQALTGTVAGLAVLGAATVPVFASDAGPFESITKAISKLFQQFYNASAGIISIIAIVLIAVCLLLRMISKDQRKVEEATAWLKRILITWLIFLFLGNIQEVIESISKDGEAKSVTF